MIIKKITKAGNYYQVLFDDNTKYKLHESILIKYHIFRKNIEVNANTLATIIKENEEFLALDKALNYLTGLHSKREVYLYILNRYDKEIAEKVIEKLEKMKLLDDREYAKNATYLMINKGFGPNKIKLELNKNDIDDDIIFEALEVYEFDTQVDNCTKAFCKHIKGLKKDSLKSATLKTKIFLNNNGFSDKVIGIVLEKNSYLLDNIIEEEKVIVKQIANLTKKYGKKYTEKDLQKKIYYNLLKKGFSSSKIKKELKGGNTSD